MVLRVADTAGCTVHTGQDALRRRGRCLFQSDVALGFQAADSHLEWSWALCIHLFRQNHRLDQSCLVCCLEHDLLESSDRRTCSTGQSVFKSRRCRSSLGLLSVVHPLKCYIGFRFGRKAHKPKSSASIGITIFDDHLNSISAVNNKSATGQLQPLPPCQSAGILLVVFRRWCARQDLCGDTMSISAWRAAFVRFRARTQ